MLMYNINLCICLQKLTIKKQKKVIKARQGPGMSRHWCFSSLIIGYLPSSVAFYQAMFRRDLRAEKSTQKARLSQDCHLVVLLSITAWLPLDADAAGRGKQLGLSWIFGIWHWILSNTQVLGESAAIRWKSYLRKQKVLGQLEHAFGFMN